MTCGGSVNEGLLKRPDDVAMIRAYGSTSGSRKTVDRRQLETGGLKGGLGLRGLGLGSPS